MKRMPYLYPLFVAIALVAGDAPVANGQGYLTNGLIAYYPLNGNANDASGHNSNGVVRNAFPISNRTGITNSAYRLAGSGWTDLPTSVLNGLHLEGTVSLWFFQESQTTNLTFVLAASSLVNGTPNRFYLSITNGQLFATLGWPSQDISGANISPQKWFHACIVWKDNGNTATLYLNGGEVGTINGTALQSPIEWFTLGAWKAEDGFLNGGLDDVRVYNRALSASEVQQLYVAESGHVAIETAAVRLRWFAESNVTYQVQWSPDFQSWSHLALILGMGLETNYVDWTDGSRKFYRVTTP